MIATDLPIPLPLEAITEICRRYQVRELSLFGSAARGEMREDSDIDLMVEFCRMPASASWLSIEWNVSWPLPSGGRLIWSQDAG